MRPKVIDRVYFGKILSSCSTSKRLGQEVSSEVRFGRSYRVVPYFPGPLSEDPP